MGEVERCSPTRVLLTHEELVNLDKSQLQQQWMKQENYINWLESQLSTAQNALTPVREFEEKLKHSISSESGRRENFLLMRLNSKEQEIQDLIVQIQELKSSQAGNSTSLRSSLLDPSVNVLIQHLRKELDKAKSAFEETQNELSAWKFTPDRFFFIVVLFYLKLLTAPLSILNFIVEKTYSNTGKRLMAKCRLLYQENEELGRMISSGRLAKLEGDLALQRNFSEEMKKSQSELDEFLLELDEDVEGMQSTIYFLQQQLRQTRDQLSEAQKENELLRNTSTNTANTGADEEKSPVNSSQSENQLNERMCEPSYLQSNSSHLMNDSDRCNGPLQPSFHND
ncbi:pre-mRNA-splicing regulator WTAP-like isoform X1 [Daphnia pulicaria]|uniref:pre-mRNA-splicing regulator WTAP-like isoform X1 n=1 Tax=Daphnia pulicaria TaxID=35523 RepID=UPI001EEB366A|nr:pre-mRNA-splicing regulator WTAP-like isoform X1 [Daphnia pulicaria]